MGWSAFQPQGKTIAIATTVAASAAAQAPGSSGGNNYLVNNSTSQACFLAYGPTAAAAVAAAVIPTGTTDATSTNTLTLGPNSTQSFTFSPGTFFATIAPATTTIVYITPGDGL